MNILQIVKDDVEKLAESAGTGLVGLRDIFLGEIAKMRAEIVKEFDDKLAAMKAEIVGTATNGASAAVSALQKQVSDLTHDLAPTPVVAPVVVPVAPAEPVTEVAP